MRLAVVTTDFPPMRGGIASLFSDLARVLSGKCPVTVLAPRAPGARDFDARQPYPVIRVSALPLLREAALLCRLGQLDRAEGVDVVACGSWFPSGLVGYLVWRRRKRPYLIWAYGSEIVDDWRNPRRVVKSLLRPLKARIFGHAAAVVAISRYTRDLVLREGVPPALVHVIAPVVDLECFTPAAPSPAARVRFRKGVAHCLLTVARLDPHKGHAVVLRALAGPLRGIPGVGYLIAGSGPEESSLRRLASSLRIEAQVDFLGDVPQADLPDLYRAADIFVMPSGILPGRLDYVEGFGIAYLEASASGKPVVAGLSGGAEDAVVDGVTGILVTPEDPGAVGRAIRTLVENPLLAQRMGAAGRERAVTTLNPDSLAERVLALAQREFRQP